MVSLQGYISESTCIPIIRHVAAGILYLHSKSIVHCDLTLRNILLSSGGAKISDFGFSVVKPNNFRVSLYGTQKYIAPELIISVLQNHQFLEYENGVDIWSLGICMYYALSAVWPFNDCNDLASFIKGKNSISGRLFQNISFNDSTKKFIRQLLEPNPVKRITTSKLATHEFLK